MPISLRPSSLEERKEFYEREFHNEIASYWFPKKPQICALELGTETNITKFPQGLKKMYFFLPVDIKRTALYYLPEDIYYDRNIYSDPLKALQRCDFRLNSKNVIGQQLAFDVDANNVPCTCKTICTKCVQKAQKEAIRIMHNISQQFNDVRLVYSGKGFHVHVCDEEAYNLTRNERKSLNEECKYCDTDVSEGKVSLIRYPFSLNGTVSRIVLPIDQKWKINEKKSLPKFL